MVQPLQPVDRSRRDGWGAHRDHRLGPSLGWGKGACRRPYGSARSPAYRNSHRHCRHAWGRLGDGSLCGGQEPHHPAAGRLSRRPRPIAGGGAPPRSGYHSGSATGRLKAGRRSLCDAARCTHPPFRRERGAASRSGAGRSAGTAIAIGRSADPARAVELRRADCRSCGSAARNREARRGSRSPPGGGRDGSAEARSRSFIASTAGSSGSASAPLVRAAIRATW